MNRHSKARLTPWSRAEIVHRILHLHQPIALVSAAFGISERTAFKCLARFRSQVAEGLRDRSSRPLCSPPNRPPLAHRPRPDSARRFVPARGLASSLAHRPRPDSARRVWQKIDDAWRLAHRPRPDSARRRLPAFQIARAAKLSKASICQRPSAPPFGQRLRPLAISLPAPPLEARSHRAPRPSRSLIAFVSLLPYETAASVMPSPSPPRFL